ncbi:MAG: hypothetical protein ACJA13_003022, partial [Paraglaciecola sp.]
MVMKAMAIRLARRPITAGLIVHFDLGVQIPLESLSGDVRSA